MSRQWMPSSLEAADVLGGGIEANFVRVLTRLLAAHAMAEKLAAQGYERSLEATAEPRLAGIIGKNLADAQTQARTIYAALGELGVSESHADRSLVAVLKRPSFAAPRYFAEHAAGELDLMMASLSLDLTGLVMIGVNYKESSYAPHARAAEAILLEKEGHELFGSNLLRDAAERFGAEAVNEGLRDWLPKAVNFFGPPGSGFTFDCLRYGLKSRDNAELADLYLSLLERRVRQAGLEMPQLTAEYPHSLA